MKQSKPVSNSSYGILLRISNLVAFIITAAINGLGATGYLSPSGENIGQISAKYQTYFTPAGYAFSIWGVIYFLVAAFVLWGLFPKQRENTLIDDQIGWWFVFSCITNVLWIATFVQGEVWTTWLSSVWLFMIVGSLLVILIRTKCFEEKRKTAIEFVVIDLNFSIYAGWTTAASIVNVATGLVASGWNGSPWTPQGWSVLMAAIASVIFLAMLYTKKNVAYAAVYIWAVGAIIVANKSDKTIVIGDAILIAIVAIACIIQTILRLRQYDMWETIA